jgi:D-alanine-D-alanine ligase
MSNTVAVLRGGPSLDHKASLKSGQLVLDYLYSSPGTHRDVFIDKDGVWHDRGRPVDPHKVLTMVDLVFNALHGPYGEDGEVQKILNQHKIPFTGSTSLPSFICSHKALSKETVKDRGIDIPRYVLCEKEDELEEKGAIAVRNLGLPIVVKSVFGEGSHWVRIATTPEELYMASQELIEHGPIVFEEFIRGKEASVYIIEGYRDTPLYLVPPVEIEKINGEWVDRCPGSFTREQREEIEASTKEVFKALDLRHYAKIDFLITPRKVYFLEANALPKFYEGSLFSKALASVGSNAEEFIAHVKDLALKR